MTSFTSEDIVPYPILGVGTLLLAWPLAFTGQWDVLLAIGAGCLVGLGLLVTAFRGYPITWKPSFLLPFFLVGWITLSVFVNTAARDSAWLELFWWVLGCLILFFTATMSRSTAYRRFFYFILLLLLVMAAGVALMLWLKNTNQRLAGLQFNANGYAGVVLWGLGPLIMMRWKPWRWRRLAIVGLVITLATFLLTISLTAGVAIGITGLIALWLHRRQTSRRFYLGLGAVLGVLALVVIGLWRIPSVRALMNPEHVRFSFIQRMDFARAGIKMGLERPIVGWGPGSFQIVYPRFSTQPNEQPRYPHNLAVQLFTETGFPGLLIWLAMVVTIGFSGWRAVHASAMNEQSMLLGLWYAWLAFTIMTLFDFNWQFPAGQSIWWAVSGLFLGLAAPHSGLVVATSRYRVVMLVVAISLLAWTGRFAMSHTSAQAAAGAENSNDIDQQVRVWEESLWWQPNRSAALRLVNTLWLRRQPQDLDQAAKLLIVLRQRNLDDYSIAYWQGMIARAQGDNDTARNYFGQAYRLDPIFHLEHALEYAKELDRAGENDKKKNVINDTLTRYSTWYRFNQNTIPSQLEALRQLR